MLRNLSGVSLGDMDSPGVGLTPKAMLYQQRPHTGEAEFVGIALPVDINMIFEVIIAVLRWPTTAPILCPSQPPEDRGT